MWKNILPVYRAGIWTHDLGNMSLLPKPLDQGSRPFPKMFGMTKYASKVLETFDMKKAFLMRFKENCLDLFRLIFEKSVTDIDHQHHQQKQEEEQKQRKSTFSVQRPNGRTHFFIIFVSSTREKISEPHLRMPFAKSERARESLTFSISLSPSLFRRDPPRGSWNVTRLDSGRELETFIREWIGSK